MAADSAFRSDRKRSRATGSDLHCDAGVTQNLPTLKKLTSLTVRAHSVPITYVAATRPGEFGLQVRLPDLLDLALNPPCIDSTVVTGATVLNVC